MRQTAAFDPKLSLFIVAVIAVWLLWNYLFGKGDD